MDRKAQEDSQNDSYSQTKPEKAGAANSGGNPGWPAPSRPLHLRVVIDTGDTYM